MSSPVPVLGFCDKCGRVLVTGSPQSRYWIVSITEDRRVIRCPQHITDWAMRCANVRRTKETYEWRRIAKEQDNPTQNILYEPFFDL